MGRQWRGNDPLRCPSFRNAGPCGVHYFIRIMLFEILDDAAEIE